MKEKDYIFRKNGNWHIYESENFRIEAYISYSYYTDGDVYAINDYVSCNDPENLTLNEILQFNNSSFSLDFIIRGNYLGENEMEEIKRIKEKIYKGKHQYVHVEDEINKENISNLFPSSLLSFPLPLVLQFHLFPELFLCLLLVLLSAQDSDC